ncbi:hypothetical protein INR49_031191 [Caranx melampygus]|nr:hypothetical protein INR49_031191 [Caranx melampygus]
MAPMGIRLSPLGVAVFCLLGLAVIYHLYAGALSSRLTVFRQRKKVKKVHDENNLKERSKGKTKEGANELLTQGDLQSHRKMYNLLRNTFQMSREEHDNMVDKAATWSRVTPADVLDKIEGGREVSAEHVTVWIDPLDATQEYTENLIKYVTTMVCVALDGKPVIGVIHQPFTQFTAWAYVGQGSNVNPRSSYNISPPSVIVSRSHSGKVRNYIHDAFGNSTIITEAGGAGGHMTTLKGEDIDYSGTPLNKEGLVASVGVDHKAILERLPNWDPEKH